MWHQIPPLNERVQIVMKNMMLDNTQMGKECYVSQAL